MSHRPLVAVHRLLAALMVLAALAAAAPTASAAQSDRGLITQTSYESPQFGYSVTWEEPWTVEDRDVITNPGGFDTITLRSETGTVRVNGRADTYNPLTFLMDTIAIQLASGGEVINQDTTAAVPFAELLIGGDRMRLEVLSLPDAGAVVLVSLRAPEASYDAALTSAQATIQLNDTPVFGAPPAGAAAATEAPAGAETPAPVSTVEVMGGGIDGSTYTSPNFGFSVSWDPAAWTVPEDAEYSEPGYDSLNLQSDTGPIWVTGYQGYDGNASTCLAGEQTYINDPARGVADWQIAVDGNGVELTGTTENSAWGVFTSMFTDPDVPNATPTPFVDYIECVSVGDGQSVVIIYSYAERAVYNDHIGKVLALSESLELAPAAATPATTPTTETPVAGTTPAQTPAAATTPAGAGQPVTVGSTEVTWTGAWEHDAESSVPEQITLTQIDIATAQLRILSYGEFVDASVGSAEEALQIFADAFFSGAGATGQTVVNSGTLPDGTVWRVYGFDLDGLPLNILLSVSQRSDGTFVVSTLTANTETFPEAVAATQQEILLNGQPTFLAGIDAPTILTPTTPIEPTPTPSVVEPTPTPAPVPSGNTITGQAYAYSFAVPVGWQVTESSLGGSIERTILTNGVSTVSIEARAMTAPTLSDCVANVAGEQAQQPVYTGLQLARTASGEPFAGEDESTAFANFTFTGPDGGTWVHFVECRWIVQGQTVLVVTQDVPEDSFGAQRAERREIQNSIVVGP